MNNIFLPNDPLLFSQNNNYKLMYEDRLMTDREQIDKQYRDYINKIQSATYDDKLEKLNSLLNSLEPEIKQQLETNNDFIQLNNDLLNNVLAELMSLIKNSVNSNPVMVQNIDKQISIINDLTAKSKEEDRKNMSEINDYIKNYSSMTFDEYKKLKNKK